MKCPIDGTQLQMTDRQGVEIDYCPECRGVWLDRGELDKIIDKSETASKTSVQPGNSYNQETPKHDYGHPDKHYKHKRKESFIGDLFDF